MLKISEVAARLNLSESSVYELVEAGKIVVHRFGKCRGAIRISEDDLRTYIESCRVGSESTPTRSKRTLRHLKF